MNGATVLAHVRERMPNLPVLILTGYPESELMAQAMTHGPFTLLRKPVRGVVLAETVEQMLEGGRAPTSK
jgi:FixJ family two-component response regulator